jgi:hypothetical protein
LTQRKESCCSPDIPATLFDSFRQSLINVVDEIVNVFESDRETDRLGPNSCGPQFAFAELTMCRRRRMNDE